MTQGLQSRSSVYSHYAALLVLSLITLAPIWVMVATGCKDDVLVQQKEPVWFFFVPTMDNYTHIMTRGKFDTYLWNSIIVGVASTFFTLLPGGMCAYALARARFAGRAFLANATLLVRMVPPAVLAVPAFAFVMLSGIDNDLAALRKQLSEAIEREDYEAAASLRDKIQDMELSLENPQEWA